MNESPPTGPQLHILMPDGSVWSAPVRDLAHRRAAYYANRDREQDPRQDYAEIYAREFHYTLNSDDELVDWARNQMDWVELDAQMVTPPPAVDYGEQWAGARVKVRR